MLSGISGPQPLADSVEASARHIVPVNSKRCVTYGPQAHSRSSELLPLATSGVSRK